MFKKINLYTVIYFTAIGFFLATAFFSGSLSSTVIAQILLITTLPYMFFARKFKYLIPVFSVFLVLYTIAVMPTAVYEATGEEPSFIIASAILGFFLVLLIGSFVSQAQWSIKSPWIANILGTLTLFIVEFSLLIQFGVDSQIIIGIIGALLYVLVGAAWLMLGPSVKVNKPDKIRDKTVEDGLLDFLTSNGYSYVEHSKQPQRRDTLFDHHSKEKESYRLTFGESILSINNGHKGIKKFRFYKDGKTKRAYSWLYREAIRSKEIKTTKDRKSEDFIYIVYDETLKSPLYDVIELPVPRSNKKVFVGVFRTNNKFTNKTLKVFDELVVDLSLRRKKY